MEHINQLVNKAQQQIESGSTKNFSDPAVGDNVRAIFSIFRAHYKRLFESGYSSPKHLNRDMMIWQSKLHSFHDKPELLKKVAIECCGKYEYVPNLAQFMKVLFDHRTHACHRAACPSLPPPPRTEREKAKIKANLQKLRQSIR